MKDDILGELRLGKMVVSIGCTMSVFISSLLIHPHPSARPGRGVHRLIDDRFKHAHSPYSYLLQISDFQDLKGRLVLSAKKSCASFFRPALLNPPDYQRKAYCRNPHKTYLNRATLTPVHRDPSPA